jgi:hypothetical protein
MPGYRQSSEWNDKNELRCLVILKKLQEANFRRGMQIGLCREMARITNLSEGNISAKVCNFKSVAGINRSSNASSNTVSIYRQYNGLSINELQQIINSK